ncbi:DNA-protecting protein DprA [Nesterenkonia sp. E16_7]|uniref:DNA-processing protein DprA n=1 Tax=unclassified Nesterenkonia TaxID=2629769 RepID=UPI001A93641F|nr:MULTISPECIES: DNA-processing protein DprA [unclassified Nesterenkonia]MBO0596085.1 DNA-protecting protein DprA [Nesterenkonia sp. E16_10]MBO0599312.1 DNA-protecting protein DprA [Nesterenkonia sp. E16_7]
MRHDSGPDAPGVEIEQERVLRAELSRLIEPGDLLAGLALETFGAQRLHALITSERAPSVSERDRMAQVADSAGLGPRQQDLRTGLARWRTRCGQLHGASDLARIRRLGGGLLIPQDPAWPAQLGDLGPLAPVAIWFRGSREESASQALGRLPDPARTVAIVGSREVTDYGIRITAQLTEDLVHAGLCVVSGGAYGVDAAAHRAALRACSDQDSGPRSPQDAVGRDPSGGLTGADRCAPTLAILAGGLDRFYPAGNERLLREVAEQGLLLSEMAPGSAPTRHRFLQRNRLIAALGLVTVITEARWRSGSQSTAHHALNLGREVGVIPGSVFSAASAGCHRLLRETPAQLVQDATDILNLAAEGAGSEAAQPPAPGQGSLAIGSMAGRRDSASRPAVQPELPLGREHPQDGLDEAQRLLFDALPRRGLSAPGKLSQVAGLPLPTVLAELTRLQRSGHARMVNGHWGRA